MTPSTGPLGYRDYQRTLNFDTPLLVNQPSETFVKPKVYGRFAVARDGYLAGQVTPEIEPVEVTLQWFMEEKGGEEVGRREFILDPVIKRGAQFRILHLGPWLQVTVNGVNKAEKYSLLAKLFSSNRVYPLEFIPPSALILSQTAVGVPSKGTKAFNPTTYFAGPAKMLVATGAVTSVYKLENIQNTGAYADFDRKTFAASILESVTVLLPTGAWRVSVENTGALEATFTVCIVPGITGAT